MSPRCMILRYNKAVQKTIYTDFRVVHEGQLRVVFTPQLKIVSWEFCVEHHEEFIPRRLVAPQIEALVQNASTSYVTSDAQQHGLQAAGQNLLKTLELPTVDTRLGFSAKHVNSLQMCEVFNFMEDLMRYSIHNNNLSPIESLKRYNAEVANAKLKMEEMNPPVEIPYNCVPSTYNRLRNGAHNYQTGPPRNQFAGPASTSSQKDTFSEIMVDEILEFMKNKDQYGFGTLASTYSIDTAKGVNASSSTNSNRVSPEDDGVVDAHPEGRK